MEHLVSTGVSEAPIKILILYGSLRERSYSRFVAQEVDRLVRFLGGETRIFNPKGLQLPDAVDASHEKVQELRGSASWSEGMIWVSPERHGAMTGIMKSQILYNLHNAQILNKLQMIC